MILEQEYIDAHLLRVLTDDAFYIITTDAQHQFKGIHINKYADQYSTKIIGTWIFEEDQMELVQMFFNNEGDADIADLLGFLTL